MDILNLEQAKAFITKDGSEIRELLAQRNSGGCDRHSAAAAAQALEHWQRAPTPALLLRARV